MKRKLLALLLTAVMLISMVPGTAFAAEGPTLTVGTATLDAGSSGSVTVSISNNTGFDSVAFFIEASAGVTVTSVSVANGIISGENWISGYEASNGKFSAYTTKANELITGDGVVCTINFNVASEANGTIAISLKEDSNEDGMLTNGDDAVNVGVIPGSITVGSSGEDDPEIPTNVNYTADLGLPTDASTAVKVGDKVSVTVLVGGTTNEFASSELNLTYTGLTFDNGTDAKADGQVSIEKVSDGAIKIIDHGQSTAWTEGTVTAYTLNFTVAELASGTTSGTASVTLSDAALSKAADASGSNLTSATVTVNKQEFTVTPADLKVNLSEDFNGASSVVYGEDYTFTAKDPNYAYVITVTGGNEATYNETTKTWTVADVTSDLTITATKTEKKFSVTINTMDHIDTTTSTPATGDKAATYKTPYTFTLKADEPVNTETGASGWKYEIDKITIGGVDYTANNSGKTYTIAGEAITGDIVITTKKTEVKPDEYTIAVNRTDVSTEELVVSPDNKVVTDGSITLTLNPVAGYTYTVTYKFGDGEAQNVTWTTGENGVKTATITNLTGNVTITASKEVNTDDIAVTVSKTEYLALNGKTMYLVQVTSKLDSDYVYTYGGSAMYYSNEYNKDNGGAYVYLVITDANTPLTADVAKTQISIASGSAVAEVDYTGDVNMTNRIDANDAQLVWNMYNAKDNQDNTYSDFNTVSMEKFLRADVNKDGKVDVNDASAVVTAVKNRTN